MLLVESFAALANRASLIARPYARSLFLEVGRESVNRYVSIIGFEQPSQPARGLDPGGEVVEGVHDLLSSESAVPIAVDVMLCEEARVRAESFMVWLKPECIQSFKSKKRALTRAFYF